MVANATYKGSFGRIPEFDFRHVISQVTSLSDLGPSEAARETEKLYLDMLRTVDDVVSPGPYNLLATRNWMLLVPRSVEHFESISVNAMGFAGSLLARNERELELIRERGPLSILEDVGRTSQSF
jgi:ATP adenylyltransferase